MKQTVPNKIKLLRKDPEFNISQEELADILGINRYRLSQIENGALPGGLLMLKICIFFNRDVRDIFFLDDVVWTTQKSNKQQRDQKKKTAKKNKKIVNY